MVREVSLRVGDLSRSLSFYRDLLGLQVHREEEGRAWLGTPEAPPFLVLLAQEKYRPRPPRTSGLFHLAIRLPSRRDLAGAFKRLLEARVALSGFADHLVSEAIYLTDPDGEGVELYADRPVESWKRRGEEIEMDTLPLDWRGLLEEAEEAEGGLPAGTSIGHVHLSVASLKASEAFYSRGLGLSVTMSSFPGALFFASGGYHHHVAVNTWSGPGIPPAPPDTVGLDGFAMEIQDPAGPAAVAERLKSLGFPCREVEGVLVATDPDSIKVTLVVTG